MHESLQIWLIWYIDIAKFSLSRSIFCVTNYPNLSDFFFIEEYQFSSTFLLLTFYAKFNFYSTLFSKVMSNFQRLLLNFIALVIGHKHKGRVQNLGHTNVHVGYFDFAMKKIGVLLF